MWGLFPDWVATRPNLRLAGVKVPKTWSALYSIAAIVLKKKGQSRAAKEFLAEMDNERYGYPQEQGTFLH